MARCRRRGRAPRDHRDGHGRRDPGAGPRGPALSSARRAGLLAGGVLAALGVVAVAEALRIQDDWQGARLMPAAVGVALLVLGLAHLSSSRGLESAPSPWPAPAGWRRVGFAFAVLALYVLALPTVGFLPGTGLLVLILVRFLGSFSWPVVVALSIVVALVSHVVFRHWLGMSLPAGALGL